MQCKIKSKQIEILDINNQSNLLSYNFSDGNSNMNSIKCYNTLFTKEGIYKNIGSYILILFNLIFIFSGILFYKSGFHFLEEDIENIIKNKKINKKNNKKSKINNNETAVPNKKNNKNSNKIYKEKSKTKKKIINL